MMVRVSLVPKPVDDTPTDTPTDATCTYGRTQVTVRGQSIITQWELITQEIAAAYLNARGPNRNLMPSTVARLARDMRHGDWEVTHQGIAFDREGRLADGQHRLQAIVDSGQPTYLLVTRGLSQQAQAAIDTGAKRTVAQVLTMQGLSYSTQVAGAASLAVLYAEGRLARRVPYPTISQQLDFLATYPDLTSLGAPLVNKDQGLQKLLPPSLIFWLYWEFDRRDPARAEQFFNTLITGEQLTADDPIYRLRSYLLDTRVGAIKRQGSSRLPLIVAVIRTWNAIHDGRAVRSLEYKRGDPIPQIHGAVRTARKES